MPPVTLSSGEFHHLTRGLIARVRAYLAESPGWVARVRAAHGLAGFCHGYPAPLQHEAFRACGLPFTSARARHPGAHLQTRRYARFLAEFSGEECVFLLHDAHGVFEEYRRLTGKGVAIVVNRRLTCRTEADYLRLVSLFYRALARGDEAGLEEAYYREFSALVRADPHFRAVSRSIAAVLRSMAGRRLRFVDIGYQATFSLFCVASLRRWTKSRARHRVHSFAVYPWLDAALADFRFSPASRLVPAIERAGRLSSQAGTVARAQGALVGFAIGDALGAPLAGLEARDARRFVDYPIADFVTNKGHPFFHSLRAGQVTANTLLLLSSAREAAAGWDDVDQYAAHLAEWSIKAMEEGADYRWVGPVTRRAMLRLRNGVPARRAGDRRTASCGGLYRVVPFAIAAYQMDFRELAELAESVSAVTHASPVARAGAVYLAIALSRLLNHEPMAVALRFALERSRELFPATQSLWRKCDEALNGALSVSVARKRFGTSSDVESTLPLALAIAMRGRDDFDARLLAAANSVRVESRAGRLRLASLPQRERLIACRGGNVDGIAAIVGALAGAECGIKRLPRAWRTKVEHHVALGRLGRVLARRQRVGAPM